MDFVMDLGTEYFRVALKGTKKILNEPTVMARTHTGRLIIGKEAADMVGRNPEIIQLFKPVSDGVIRDLDTVVQLIQHAVKVLAPSTFTRKFNLTLAVPSGLTQVEQKVVEDAARLAGARHVQLVNSIVAAAEGAGLPISKPTGSLVVSLGAGVTEAAVLSMNGIVESQRLRMGGRTIDEGTMERLRKEYSFLIGQKSAEQLKHRFSEDKSAPHIGVRGRDLQTGLPGQLSVPRSVIDDQLEMYCDAITDLIAHTISTCPPELVGDITEQGVVLVGGGSQAGGLLERLLKRLDVPINLAEGPDTCVIRGLLARPWHTKRTSGFATRPNFFSIFDGLKGAVNFDRSVSVDSSGKTRDESRK